MAGAGRRLEKPLALLIGLKLKGTENGNDCRCASNRDARGMARGAVGPA
jgi:hypothetical protein